MRTTIERNLPAHPRSVKRTAPSRHTFTAINTLYCKPIQTVNQLNLYQPTQKCQEVMIFLKKQIVLDEEEIDAPGLVPQTAVDFLYVLYPVNTADEPSNWLSYTVLTV